MQLGSAPWELYFGGVNGAAERLGNAMGDQQSPEFAGAARLLDLKLDVHELMSHRTLPKRRSASYRNEAGA
jgi:hypothetical protein